LGCDEVAAAAVIGVDHPRWGEAVVGAVKIKPGHLFDEDALIAQCKASLANFEVPKRIIQLESMPTTATGKLQKFVLRNQLNEIFSNQNKF
jgi:long-chain acyl-CoA synthetase